MATETRPLVRSDDYEQSTNYSSSQSDSLEGGGEGFVTVDVNGDQVRKFLSNVGKIRYL